MFLLMISWWLKRSNVGQRNFFKNRASDLLFIFSLPNHLAVIDFKGIEDKKAEKYRNESINHFISRGDRAYQL